jgi:hypothetical protein
MHSLHINMVEGSIILLTDIVLYVSKAKLDTIIRFEKVKNLLLPKIL